MNCKNHTNLNIETKIEKKKNIWIKNLKTLTSKGLNQGHN